MHNANTTLHKQAAYYNSTTFPQKANEPCILWNKNVAIASPLYSWKEGVLFIKRVANDPKRFDNPAATIQAT